MARFLTPEWAEEVNGALAEVPALPEDAAKASVMASGGSFTVIQVVSGAPAEIAPDRGVVQVVLTVDGGRPSLAVRPGPPGEDGAANVTISIEYAQAAALNQGRIDPAGALARGDVRVRGDLSVLTASQHLWSTAGERLQAVQAATAY